MDITSWLSHNVPFMALVMGQTPSHNRPLATRITEQLVVGLIAGTASLYVSDARQEDRLAVLADRLRATTETVDKQAQKLESRIDRLDSKIDTVRNEMYEHGAARKR